MKKLVLIAALTAGMTTASYAQQTVSGTTNFRVIVPEILVLYHWDDAVLNLTAPADEFVYNDGTPATNSLNKNVGSTSATIIGTAVDTTTVPFGFNTNDKLDVTLKNSWAVRSISSADVKLKIENPNPTLTRVGGSEIVKTSLPTLNSDSATGGNDTLEVTLPSQWAAISGDIKFKLNLTGATKPGEYNSHGTAYGLTGAPGDTLTDNAKDTFKLTLTGN